VFQSQQGRNAENGGSKKMALKSIISLFNYMVKHKGENVTVENVDRASKKPGYSSKHISMLRRRGCIIDSVRGDTEKMENGREVLGYILRKHPEEIPTKPSNIRHLGEKQKRPRKESGDRVARTSEPKQKRKVSVAQSVKEPPADQQAAVNGSEPPAQAAGGESFALTPAEQANFCDVDEDFENVEGLSNVDDLLDQHHHNQ
jgi:hypothetical protein